MAYTFFKSMGYSVGNSICEIDKIDLAKNAMEKAKAKGVKLMLPVDNVISDNFDFENYATQLDVHAQPIDSDQIPDGWEGLDIGPKTIALFSEELQKAKTILWNGPVGFSEHPSFANGTDSLAKLLASLEDCTTIIGGGDSAAAMERIGISDKMTHISTGGGASLEFLEGKKLPGIECLQDKE